VKLRSVVVWSRMEEGRRAVSRRSCGPLGLRNMEDEDILGLRDGQVLIQPPDGLRQREREVLSCDLVASHLERIGSKTRIIGSVVETSRARQMGYYDCLADCSSSILTW
jgi:hypothetical protein